MLLLGVVSSYVRYVLGARDPDESHASVCYAVADEVMNDFEML